MASRTMLIPVFDRLQSLDVTGPLEVFDRAARIADPARPAYTVVTASVHGGPVRTSSGLDIVPAAALDRVGDIDTLVVPGGPGTREPHPDLVEWLRRSAPRARRVAAVCTGAFLLARSGLLAGRRATTHWSHCDSLARDFPDITVDPDPIFVRDGNIATSAGVTAGIDLALALVEEDLGRDTALTVARHLVVYLRRPGNQAQFSTHLAAQTAAREPLRDLQHWIAGNLDADLSVEALAARVQLSPRQFARVFTAEIGITPGRYVDRTRLETARRLLEDTDDGVERTARTCGYGTPEAMRRAFVRALGVSPADYRHRFRPTAH
ncbi:transcriptional regulator GlxA family with amidase domain [Nocardiopsis mwathae]|uniref:Transcriptional regulator GlxA family with amidase domain n=1 Tax=Nocardiopsis mwathae TaxID=1472723 RepID=A0A7W9YGG6_9ACTN|nr:GlxA family transcriptional regulator [Nocardiopsis mwathae]MBB6171642.1 transcriptional regulator GlxA family with amidase domain [Nocardiopsis mwathae]